MAKLGAILFLLSLIAAAYLILNALALVDFAFLGSSGKYVAVVAGVLLVIASLSFLKGKPAQPQMQPMMQQ